MENMLIINKPRLARNIIKLQRLHPDSFIEKAVKSFAAKTRETILYARNFEKTHKL